MLSRGFPAMTSEIGKKRKLNRRVISLEEKIKILDRLESGERFTSIAKQLNLNESTIRTIKRNESKIRTMVPTGSVGLNKIARIRNTLILKMENCLTIWMEDCRRKNVPLNSHMIKEMAKKIYAHLKEVECVSSDETHKCGFSASNGWYERFKNRFSLHNLKTQEERASANVEAALKFLEKFPRIIEDGNYGMHQVFCVAKASLFWKKMPQRSDALEYEQPLAELDDKITLLLSCNASGDCTTRPMMINSSLKPLMTRVLDDSRFPIFWRANKGAKITEAIFHDWFFNCFVTEVEDYCARRNISFKILLIIDSLLGCKATFQHPNIRILFLPPNTESILHPLLQGVTEMFKCFYVRRRFESIFEKMNCNASRTHAQLCNDFSIKECIEMISLSLKELNPSTLNTSWKNIWPSAVIKAECTNSLTAEIGRIVNIARSVGCDEFQDISEEGIYDLINGDQELDEEELVQLADKTVGNSTKINAPILEEEPFEEPEQELSLESLNEGLELSKRLEAHFAENDPLPERFAEFQRKLRETLAPYVKLQQELQAKNARFMRNEIFITDIKQEDSFLND